MADRRVTHIELDETKYLEAKIFIYSDDFVVKVIKPKWDNRYEVFTDINKMWVKQLKKERDEQTRQ